MFHRVLLFSVRQGPERHMSSAAPQLFSCPGCLPRIESPALNPKSTQGRHCGPSTLESPAERKTGGGRGPQRAGHMSIILHGPSLLQVHTTLTLGPAQGFQTEWMTSLFVNIPAHQR